MITRVFTSLVAHTLAVAIALTAMAPWAWAETDGAMNLRTEYRLPVQTALQAARGAMAACRDQGADVSTSVVDQHGQPLVQLQGDQAAPHTWALSLQKAYTAVALAPLQGVQSTSEVAAKLRTSHQGIGDLALPASSVTNITPVAGGLVIQAGKHVLGGIGISGAPSGTQDEDCAAKGLLTIESSLRSPTPAVTNRHQEK